MLHGPRHLPGTTRFRRFHLMSTSRREALRLRLLSRAEQMSLLGHQHRMESHDLARVVTIAGMGMHQALLDSMRCLGHLWITSLLALMLFRRPLHRRRHLINRRSRSIKQVHQRTVVLYKNITRRTGRLK